MALGGGMRPRGARAAARTGSRRGWSLLQEAGAPVYSGDGAARAVHTDRGRAAGRRRVDPLGRPADQPDRRAPGTGAGCRELDRLPNVLRVVLAHPARTEDEPVGSTAVVLEANVDDLDPRV